MTRLLIHVEGETEETFVKEVLTRHLRGCGYERVGARLVGNARLRQRRGGIRAWSSVRADIVRHLREDAGAIATTLVDYYALPRTGDKAWPGRDRAAGLSFELKAVTVEQEIESDLTAFMGADFNPRRFIPFVVMHEFEGLLFSDCGAFSRSIGHPELKTDFQKIRDDFKTPEEIDDSPVTAPSKRVQKLIPNYEKPLLGTLAALAIGLDTIRAECPHFNDWLTRLESAAAYK
jgi:hypothetical protein